MCIVKLQLMDHCYGIAFVAVKGESQCTVDINVGSSISSVDHVCFSVSVSLGDRL